MEIITDFPVWYLGLCALGGLLYAFGLYYRNMTTRHLKVGMLILLGLFRFVMVTTLAIFLLKPLVKSVKIDIEKPIIVIAQDNSESVVAGKDSTFIKNQYLNQLKLLESSLGDQYDVRSFSFGAQVTEGLDSIDFSDKYTDFSDLLEEIDDRFSNRNLGAVLIGSDGLYNRGINPDFASTALEAPVYTIALGDTGVKRDVQIREVAHNRLAYLGNKFPLEIHVDGIEAAGETVQLSVQRKGEIIFSQTINFNGDYQSEVVATSIEAKNTGLQRFTVSVSSVDGEFTLTNNKRDIFVDVLDSRQKILILASAPHPDLNAIRQAISSNKNYEVELSLADDFSGQVDDYNLIVFHQIPNFGNRGLDIAQLAIEKEIPGWFILGTHSNFNEFNQLQLGFSLKNHSGIVNDILGTYSENFSLFTLDDDIQAIFKRLPPLQVPFGDFQESQGTTPLITQRIGLIETQHSLIGFNTVGRQKIGLIAGEGIWRWRMVNFLETGSHDTFDTFISKCVQYLASKEDKSFFRVHGKTDLLENEPLVFEAELYNKSYESVNHVEVSFVVNDEEGKEFTYLFSPRGEGYRLDLGGLPVGNYSYVAKAGLSGNIYTETGEFSVSPVQLEMASNQANHALMYNLARSHDGEMIFGNEVGKLSELIANRGDLVSVSHESKIMTDLINYRWILGLVLVLLSAEWLLRKRNGTY